MKTILEKKYYSLKDIAKATGIPYLTIVRWKDKGKLKIVKFGEQYFMIEEDFNNLNKDLFQTI